MEQAQSSAQSLLHTGDTDLGEESGLMRNNDIPIVFGPTNHPGNFRDVSPLHTNEGIENPERTDRGSPRPAINGPLTHPLLNGYDIEMNEWPHHSRQGVSLPDNEVQAITRQQSGDTSKTSLSQQSAWSKKISPKAPAHTATRWDRFSRSTARIWAVGWGTETCSYIVAVLALAGLVATLCAHQDRPLPQWPQLVTINSIISLFSLLMRACVGVVLAEGISQCKWNWYRKAKKLDHIERLDSASRGSWGSVTLLYHFRPRQAYYLATMGATITILASFTGFFAQQLVQLQDCLERDPAALVNISRTNSYNETGGRVTGRSNADFAPMVAAINVGMLQAPGDLTNTLSLGCSSGNCTFSEHGDASFSTLAISYSCEDISKQIRIINETKHDPPKTPAQMYLGLDYGQSGLFEWDNTDPTVIYTWTDRSIERSELTTVYFLFRSKYLTSSWSVTNCSLFPTVNTYAARIKDAVLKEDLVESSPLRKIAPQFGEPPVRDQDYLISDWWTYRMITNYTIKNGIRVTCQGSDTPAPGLTRFMKSSDDPTYVNSTGHTNPSVGWKWWYFPEDCDWTMRERASSAIAKTLDEVFSDQTLNQTLKGGVNGPAHLRVMHESGNMTSNSVDKRIQGLATAMTTIIRTYGGGGFDANNREYAIGTVWRNTTCVYIRWSWIAFPSVMIGLTGVFLLWVAFENRGIESDKLWKSSFLAALFCEVELHEKPVGKEEMKNVAKSTSVSLEDKRATLRLVVG